MKRHKNLAQAIDAAEGNDVIRYYGEDDAILLFTEEEYPDYCRGLALWLSGEDEDEDEEDEEND